MAEQQPFEWFDKVIHRTRITATVRLESGLRVGVGRDLDAGATDLPILTDAAGRPLVPGASWKGVVRSTAERLLRGWGHVHKFDEKRIRRELACDPLDEKHPCVKVRDEEDAATLGRVEAHREAMKKVCLCCATFGAPGLASHVRFRDMAFPRDTPTRVRDGVSIDRDLGRVSGARKYDFQVIEPGASARLTIDLDNDQDWQTGLVLAALDFIDDGLVRLGGFGSRGLGVVRLEAIAVERWKLDAILAGSEGEKPDTDTLRAAFTKKLDEIPKPDQAGGK